MVLTNAPAPVPLFVQLFAEEGLTVLLQQTPFAVTPNFPSVTTLPPLVIVEENAPKVVAVVTCGGV